MTGQRFGLAAMGVFAATAGAAQEATRLDRIVVSAGEEKVAIETPQAVTVIEREDIEILQPDTIGDAIETAPGVTTVGADRVLGESLNIRGIGTAASSDEPRIIFNVDGVTRFYEQYRLGSYFTDPELFKRVEILRGPASSTLYGSGAIAGVVALETRDPADFIPPDRDWALRPKVGITFNENDTGFLVSGIAAYRPAEGFEVLLNGTFRNTPEYTDGSGVVVDGTDSETYSGLLKGVFTFGQDDASQIDLSWTRFQTELNDQPYSQTGLGGGIFNAFGTVDRDIEDDVIQASYSYTPADNDWIDLTLSLAYSSSRNEQDDVDPNLIFAFGETWEVEYNSWQFRGENTATIAGSNWEAFLTGGLQAARQDRVSDATLFGQPFNIGSHPGGEQLSLGAYFQAEVIYDNWLTIIPGVRIDYIETEADGVVPDTVTIREHDFTLVSPKIAALAQVTDWLGVFGSIAHTERAPVIDELYDVDNFNTPQIGDPEKEKSFNIEGGVALSFTNLVQSTDALQIKTTAFYNEIDDLIFRSNDGLPYTNDASAEYYGLEIEAAYESRFYFARLAYSMIRGELFDGTNLDSIPADELRATVGFRVPSYDIEVGWTSVLAAAQDDVSNPANMVPGGGAPTPGYAVHDIYASWTPDQGMLAGTEVRLAIENVFDKRYRPHLSGDEAPGLTAKLTLARAF
ncbi:MAG: TonB-dependent receptor [Pseudomonadota bacterium]